MDSVQDFSATIDTENQNHNILWDYNIPYQNCSVHENFSNYAANLNMEPLIVNGLNEQANGDSSNTSALALSTCDLIDLIDDILPNLEETANGLEYSFGQDDLRSIETPKHVISSIIDDIIPTTSEETGNGLEHPRGQNDLRIVETPTSVISSMSEDRLSEGQSTEEPPKKAAEKGKNKVNLMRNRKNISARFAQEDKMLDVFLSKKAYRRTVMRPKRNGAPVPDAGESKKELTEKTRGKIGSSSIGGSTSEDDVLDLRKFTRKIPEVNFKHSNAKKIVVLSNVLIVPPYSVNSVQGEIGKGDKAVEGGNKLENAKPISSSISENCLPQERAESEAPKVTAVTGTGKLKSGRIRKNTSQKPAKNDDVLNNFVSRKYNKTLVRPPKSRASLNKITEVNVKKDVKGSDGTARRTRPILDLPVPKWENATKPALLRSNAGLSVNIVGSTKRENGIEEDRKPKNRDRKRSRSTIEIYEGEARKDDDKKRKRSDRSEHRKISNNKDKESKPKRRNTKGTQAPHLDYASTSSDVLERHYSPISPTSLREYIEPSPAQNQLDGGNPSSQNPMEIYYSPISPARPLEKTEQYTIPNPYLHQFGSGYLNRDAKEDHSWINTFEQLVPEEYLLFPSRESSPTFSPRRPV